MGAGRNPIAVAQPLTFVQPHWAPAFAGATKCFVLRNIDSRPSKLPAAMKPLSALPRETLAKIQYVFSDVDDTITTHARVTARVLAAMEALRDANIKVVPVTGRPAGWCHGLARAWPIAGVVAENGAVAYWLENTTQRELFWETDAAERARQRSALAQIQRDALAKFPMFHAAQDQFMRVGDIAFDHAENIHPPIPAAQIAALVAYLKSHQLATAVSSIHAHGAFGTRNKFTMTQSFIEHAFKTTFDAINETSIFVGDSHNDSAMFEAFTYGVGVANVVQVLSTPPRYVTHAREGDGFIELAQAILSAKV
jgi:HAD superfamily hydrolase (TIGR01484 family)